MGSVMKGVGGVLGSVTGGIGGGIIDGADANNTFSPGSPYNQAYIDQLLGNQNNIYNQQQSLAAVLSDQMNGKGPNPAQTQYMANTQNNIANAQGMIASQRGLNPALAARMGSNQASKENANASFGSAILQQKQQLAAQDDYNNLLNQMQAGNVNYQNMFNTMYGARQQAAGAIAGQNSAQRAGMAGMITMPLGNFAGQSAMTSGGGASTTGGATNTGASTAAGSSGPANAATMSEVGEAALYSGGFVSGKANVPGDSPQNDTVDIKASPGEIVIPRSMAHDPEKAKEFIDHLLKEDGGKKKTEYGEVLKARRKKAS
jgi:hypothetical protein